MNLGVRGRLNNRAADCILCSLNIGMFWERKTCQRKNISQKKCSSDCRYPNNLLWSVHSAHREVKGMSQAYFWTPNNKGVDSRVVCGRTSAYDRLRVKHFSCSEQCLPVAQLLSVSEKKRGVKRLRFLSGEKLDLSVYRVETSKFT